MSTWIFILLTVLLNIHTIIQPMATRICNWLVILDFFSRCDISQNAPLLVITLTFVMKKPELSAHKMIQAILYKNGLKLFVHRIQ